MIVGFPPMSNFTLKRFSFLVAKTSAKFFCKTLIKTVPFVLYWTSEIYIYIKLARLGWGIVSTAYKALRHWDFNAVKAKYRYAYNWLTWGTPLLTIIDDVRGHITADFQQFSFFGWVKWAKELREKLEDRFLDRSKRFLHLEVKPKSAFNPRLANAKTFYRSLLGLPVSVVHFDESVSRALGSKVQGASTRRDFDAWVLAKAQKYNMQPWYLNCSPDGSGQRGMITWRLGSDTFAKQKNDRILGNSCLVLIDDDGFADMNAILAFARPVFVYTFSPIGLDAAHYTWRVEPDGKLCYEPLNGGSWVHHAWEHQRDKDVTVANNFGGYTVFKITSQRHDSDPNKLWVSYLPLRSIWGSELAVNPIRRFNYVHDDLVVFRLLTNSTEEIVIGLPGFSGFHTFPADALKGAKIHVLNDAKHAKTFLLNSAQRLIKKLKDSGNELDDTGLTESVATRLFSVLQNIGDLSTVRLRVATPAPPATAAAAGPQPGNPAPVGPIAPAAAAVPPQNPAAVSTAAVSTPAIVQVVVPAPTPAAVQPNNNAGGKSTSDSNTRKSDTTSNNSGPTAVSQAVMPVNDPNKGAPGTRVAVHPPGLTAAQRGGRDPGRDGSREKLPAVIEEGTATVTTDRGVKRELLGDVNPIGTPLGTGGPLADSASLIGIALPSPSLETNSVPMRDAWTETTSVEQRVKQYLNAEILTEAQSRLAFEFVGRLSCDRELEPMDLPNVAAARSTPRAVQRALNDGPRTHEDPDKSSVSVMIKIEAIAPGAPARVICNVRPAHNTLLSSYVNVLGQSLKAVGYSAFVTGYDPCELALNVRPLDHDSPRVASYVVCETDYSRFDATASRSLCDCVSNYLLISSFKAEYHNQIETLLANEQDVRLVSDNVKLKVDCMNLSGSAFTTWRNTIHNAFLAYLGLRSVGVPADEAFFITTHFNRYQGDDGLSYVPAGKIDAYCAAVNSTGVSLKITYKPYPIFLGRSWFLGCEDQVGRTPSMCDISRALYNLGVSSNTAHTWQDAWYLKCSGRLITDSHTPIVGAWCQAAVTICEHFKVKPTRTQDTESLSWNALNFNADNWVAAPSDIMYNEAAEATGFDVADIHSFETHLAITVDHVLGGLYSNIRDAAEALPCFPMLRREPKLRGTWAVQGGQYRPLDDPAGPATTNVRRDPEVHPVPQQKQQILQHRQQATNASKCSSKSKSRKTPGKSSADSANLQKKAVTGSSEQPIRSTTTNSRKSKVSQTRTAGTRSSTTSNFRGNSPHPT